MHAIRATIYLKCLSTIVAAMSTSGNCMLRVLPWYIWGQIPRHSRNLWNEASKPANGKPIGQFPEINEEITVIKKYI